MSTAPEPGVPALSESDIASLATAWVRYWKAPDGSAEKESLFWVSGKEWDLVSDSPADGWRLILAVLRFDGSTQIREVLAAGPLEDLLVKHGDAMIESVEHEARHDPAFASLLGGVWRNAMSESVWTRVRAVWNR